MSRELLQQALDEMARYQVKSGDFDRFDDVIKNLRQALAQPELVVNEKDGSPCPEFWDWLPKAYNFEGNGTFTKYNMEVAFLAGKNTALAQPEQEPVAWLYNGHLHECDPSEWAVTDVIPLYKLPPHKPWVGLTDGEINKIANSPQPIDETSNGYVLPFAHAIQSRLKEKNT